MTSATTAVSRMRPKARLLTLLAALAAVATGLAGCASDPINVATDESSPPAQLTITDAWVKAADSGMTAAFGILVNNSDADITVVSGTSPVSTIELHEVVMDGGVMTMRPKEGGFVVPAKGTHELAPGGDHIMLMDVKEPVKAGDEVEFTLTLDDGSTMTFTAVAKPFAGGNETYDPGTPTHDG